MSSTSARRRTSRPGSSSASSPPRSRRAHARTRSSSWSTRRWSRSVGGGRRRAARAGGRGGRGGGDRPRREVDLPRPGAARLLPDPRPEPARPGRAAVLPRPRGGADPHAEVVRAQGDAHRRPDGSGSNPTAEDRVDRRAHLPWVTTHGYALNVDLDPAPFTEWITACGLEDAAFTTMARELGRPLTVDDVRPRPSAIERVFGLELEELPAEDDAGLWPSRCTPRQAEPLT